MKPTYEEMLTANCVWTWQHQGIWYKLSWHGYANDCMPEGIWCWYITLRRNQFSAETWETLRILNDDGSVDYWEFPDVGAHGGWTYGKLEKDDHGNELLTVGCDYNHLWDHELYWPHDKTRVEAEARAAIDKFLQLYPVEAQS